MSHGLPPVPTPQTADLPPEIDVVHVDDDTDFVEMSREFLERADERISVRTVTDPTEVVEVVQAIDAHCVVSDYDMPGLNGLELFDRLREVDSDIPFVLFTGKGSEAIAADAITAGVTDYIQKGGTDTYEVVANRVLEAVKSRQRRKAVDRAVNHYTALVEASHVPVYLYDEGGTIQYANEASADVFGVDDPDAIVGESFFDLLPGDTHDEIQSRLSQLEDERRVPETELEFEDLSGTPRRIRISCAPTPHHDEAIGQTIAHDVMRAEKTRRELESFHEFTRTALERGSAGLWIHDVRSDSISRYGVAALLDVEPDELTDDLDSFLAYVHPEDRNELKSAYVRATEHADEFCIDFRIETDIGTTRQLEDRGAVMTDEEGAVTHVVGIMMDVTNRERERRRLH